MAQRQDGSGDEGEKVRVWRLGRHARGRGDSEWFPVKVNKGKGPVGSSGRNWEWGLMKNNVVAGSRGWVDARLYNVG